MHPPEQSVATQPSGTTSQRWQSDSRSPRVASSHKTIAPAVGGSRQHLGKHGGGGLVPAALIPLVAGSRESRRRVRVAMT
jgi:hypothetical protein